MQDGHYHLAVELTPEQAHHSYLGKPIQIHPNQFGKGHIFVHHENHLKLARAHRAGKGVRIHLGPDELMHTAHHHVTHGLDGNGIWGKIWHGIKSGFNWLKKSGVLTQLTDTAAQAASTMYPAAAPAISLARNELKQRAGFGVGKKRSATGSGLYLS